MNPAMWMPGPWEIGVVGVIAVLVFGNRLPKVARGIGSSIVQFKRGLKDVAEELDETQQALEDAQK